MRKFLILSLPLLVAAGLIAAPGYAQDTKGAAKTPAKSGDKKADSKKADKKGGAKKGGETTVSGMIKGTPNASAKTFTLASPKKTVEVDASKATIRVNGKFAKFEELKGGSQATVKGAMSGDKLMATDVNAHPRGGGKKKGEEKKAETKKGDTKKGGEKKK
jgi:hypothetical protein